MILSINLSSQEQSICFNRKEVEVLAKSNLERLKYIELYDTALIELNNLNERIVLYKLDIENKEILIDTLYFELTNINKQLKEQKQIIEKQNNTIKKLKIISGSLIIITLFFII